LACKFFSNWWKQKIYLLKFSISVLGDIPVMPKLSDKPIVSVCRGIVLPYPMHHTLLSLFCVAAEVAMIVTTWFVMSWGTRILVQIIAVNVRILFPIYI